MMGSEAAFGRTTVWSAPGAFLWVPVLVHVVIGIEIAQLALDRARGMRDGFDGFDPTWHILLISVPVASAVAVGWAVMALLKRKVNPHTQTRGSPGCVRLGLLAVFGPALLFLALRGALAI